MERDAAFGNSHPRGSELGGNGVGGLGRLELVPPPSPRYTLLAMWHLLSLDASTVAVVWTVFVARCAGVALPWHGPVAMFVAVWMLYAADRLLDARPLPDGSTPPELEERHRFHHRYRTRFLFGIVGAAIALAMLLHQLNSAALHLYALLAVMLGAWLLLIHARAAELHRLPKELAVGVFFPAAVFIPTVARVPSMRMELLPAAALLAGVCTLNCLMLYAWEHPAGSEANRGTAHATTRWAIGHLRHLAAGLTVAASVLVVIGPLRLLAGACVLSTLALLALHEWRRALATLTLRASADVALLTPLLLLWWRR